MAFASTDILIHLALAGLGGFSLKCALGFCQHAEHSWRRWLAIPLFCLFAYIEAIVTVAVIG